MDRYRSGYPNLPSVFVDHQERLPRLIDSRYLWNRYISDTRTNLCNQRLNFSLKEWVLEVVNPYPEPGTRIILLENRNDGFKKALFIANWRAIFQITGDIKGVLKLRLKRQRFGDELLIASQMFTDR